MDWRLKIYQPSRIIMARIVAIISYCLAALLLTPAQGQYSEILESEMDPDEVECYVMSCQERQSVTVKDVLKDNAVSKTEDRNVALTGIARKFTPVVNLGILYCILRE